ncbi:MAG: acyl-CoA carboxylase subunit epsilon [Candidatus Saccharibacteria bacterium]|nr:acyl-CoA carboxylase subunit epsilon [Microbacteriaceae bacterium]
MTLQRPTGDAPDHSFFPATSEFEVVAGRPTPAEIAAVTAVMASMIEDLEDDQRVQGPRVSAWQRSQRSVRAPMNPGAGAWRSFSG